MPSFRWRGLGSAAGAAMILASLLTCTDRGGPIGIGSPQAGLAAIEVYLTDAPATYDRVWVTMPEVAIHKAGGGVDEPPAHPGERRHGR